MESTSVKTEKQSNKDVQRALIWLYFVLAIVSRIIMSFITFTQSSALVVNIISLVVFLTISIFCCYYWTKYKGLSRGLAALGIIPLIGFLTLAFMKDKNPN